MIENRSRWTVAATILAVMLTASQWAMAAGSGSSKGHAPMKKQMKGMAHHLYGNHECPVSGDKVDPKVYYTYKDEEHGIYGRIFECCSGCTKKTAKSAKSIYEKLYRTDKKTGKAIGPRDLKNKTCPVSGDEIDSNAKIEYNGMIVHFCCKKCIKTFLKDPDKYLTKLLPDAKEFEFMMGDMKGMKHGGGGSGSAN